jgi:hypothetical protein
MYQVMVDFAFLETMGCICGFLIHIGVLVSIFYAQTTQIIPQSTRLFSKGKEK